MTTKAELEKMIEERAEYYATNEGATIEKIEAFTVDKHLGNPQQYEYVKRYNNDSFCSFKSGASFVTGILMPEIERVENNCDTLENKAIFWMETNDRAIEHTESLQLTITTLKTEIQSLKDENKRMKEVIKCCDSDYWFMINLIEHYSTNKDDALKDCLERMKFRKPMFKTALNQGEE